MSEPRRHESRQHASEGWTHVTGPVTVDGEFYGVLPLTDFVATSITAEGCKDHEGEAGVMEDVPCTAGLFIPVVMTQIVLPAGGDALLQNVNKAV